MRRYLHLLCVVLLIANRTAAQKSPANANNDSLDVVKQLKDFTVAFNNLDYEHFQNFFSTEVTVFFPPSAMVAERINGKDSVMSVFKKFFAKVKQGKSAPPYLDIDPQKTQIKIFGDIAIISFELTDPDALSRRTIIMKKENQNWLIIHLHASKINK